MHLILHGHHYSCSLPFGSSPPINRTPHMSKKICVFAVRKSFWIPGWRIVRRMHKSLRPGVSVRFSKMCILVFPKASLTSDIESQFSELGRSLITIFETEEPSEVAKLVSGSASEELHSGNLLHHLSTIPTGFLVDAAALLAGTSIGFLISKFMQKQHLNDFKPFAEHLLITNSTPFNRFVLMRCSSLKFKDLDVYDGLLKKLTAEGRHVIRIFNDDRHGIREDDNTNNISDSPLKMRVAGQLISKNLNGGMPFQRDVSVDTNTEKFSLVYQRTFLNANDGGVLALDWPSHLELSGEHGLDTIFLLVPGFLDGSKGMCIQSFVQRCVKHGFFPVVLNPRGCGGSPLTTPRLFTAGDSDDVRMAVEFILSSRSSSTIMAVGWGYGADMLMKYLGEEAASTPVTAAVCIDNTFDLEEASKFSQDDNVNLFNQMMTQTFVEILKSNQMVFEGKERCFNVQKGLSAKSVREFDEAISIVSRGYNSLQKLYKDYSSKSWINKVKIPILCVQASYFCQ